ncbi:FK506-binding protein 5-like isoform X2 [Dreissena polymorpha]|nr:FK506-binding protein 5-like isoform X2 [Dreissena polymorpha]XP_052215334.1 FK506-binding protein 5-like isoform X2 [Dreissena polymorpha]XP_052215335.1 FK506-binding protein 5-like isoform X2 [Dreissena polymorpha]
MADIAALKELEREIEQFRNLPPPPGELKLIDAFSKQQKQRFNEAAIVIAKVNQYADSILLKIDELKNTIPQQKKIMQQAIEDIIRSIKVRSTSTFNSTFHGHDDPIRHTLTFPALNTSKVEGKNKNTSLDDNLEKLQTVRALEEVAKGMEDNRLRDLIQETEDKLGKVKKGGILTQQDIDDLNGCVDSWKKANAMSYAAEKEQKRHEEETRRKAAEEEKRQVERERKRKQEEDRKKKEEQERKKREEEERKRIEEEEKQKREEEERRRKEEERKKHLEEERQRKEDEVKRRREAEEQRRKEEEERKLLEEKKRLEEEARKRDEEEHLRQEEERKRKEEEDDRKRKAEDERLRLEEERKKKREEERQRRIREEAERERKRKEEEERARRLDPNNWKPLIFERPCDEVEGKRPYHDGLCCMLASPSNEITQDSVQCSASDELDDIIQTLDEDERPTSSSINVQTNSNSIATECPSRVYVPHNPISSASEELVIKYSINGSDWHTSEVLRPTQQIENIEDYATTNLIGFEANNFDKLKIMVVSRQKSQNVIIDKAGLTVTSTADKNVKLYTPRDAFTTRTNVRLSVVNKTMDLDDSTVVSDLFSDVISLGPLITIVCESAPQKDLEVDITRPASGHGIRQRSTRHHLIMSRGKVWTPAEREYKDTSNVVVSVKLPANRERYTIVEVELPTTSPKENAMKLAESFHTQSIQTIVHVVLRQNETNPQNAKIVVVQPHALKQQLQRLSNDGFSLGPDANNILSLKEGQRLSLSSRGNVQITDAENGTVTFTFYKYMNKINKTLKLQAKDIYLQRNLPEYNGLLEFIIDNGTEIPNKKIEFTVHLPKIDAPRGGREMHRIRFPYYLTCLAGYLSKCICEKQPENWQDIVGCFIDKTQLKSLIRVAKRRISEVDQRTLCRNVLHDWMKQTTKQDDKVQIILEGLYCHRHTDIYENCKQFVRYQKETMADKTLAGLASSVTLPPDEVASVLNIQPEMLQAIKADYIGDDLILQMLTEWRESDDAINLGHDAFEELRKLMSN